MRNKKTVLKVLIKLQYFKETSNREQPGFCIMLHKMNIAEQISSLQLMIFKRWLDHKFSTQNIFYFLDGHKTDNRDQFIWPPYEQEARDKFLQDNINELKILTKF